MNHTFAASFLLAGALMLPAVGHSADSDSDRSAPTAFVKDSLITTKVKAELAEAKMSSLVHIKVDTNDKGAVTLTGTAPSPAAIDKAVSITNAVKGVTSVENHIQIAADK